MSKQKDLPSKRPVKVPLRERVEPSRRRTPARDTPSRKGNPRPPKR